MALQRIVDGATAEVELKVNGKLVGAWQTSEVRFGTGSRGFQIPGPVNIDGKRYQANLQIVEVGSKAAGGPTAQQTAPRK